MKIKKIIAAIFIGMIAAAVLSSCAIDRKCPAYSKGGDALETQSA